MRLWLDDRRPPPEGWRWVKTPQEAIDLVRVGDVAELSLDHDLGLVNDVGRELTGYDVLLWIEEEVATNGLIPPALRVHSANPPAHDRMDRAIESINKRLGR